MSNETIVEKWGNLGFLKDINNDKLERLSLYYENACKHLLSDPNEQTNNVETYIFPILHRLVKDTDLEFNPISLIQDFKLFINRPDIHGITTEIYGSNIDLEAEIVNIFIQEVKEKNQV